MALFGMSAIFCLTSMMRLVKKDKKFAVLMCDMVSGGYEIFDINYWVGAIHELPLLRVTFLKEM